METNENHRSTKLFHHFSDGSSIFVAFSHYYLRIRLKLTTITKKNQERRKFRIRLISFHSRWRKRHRFLGKRGRDGIRGVGGDAPLSISSCAAEERLRGGGLWCHLDGRGYGVPIATPSSPLLYLLQPPRSSVRLPLIFSLSPLVFGLIKGELNWVRFYVVVLVTHFLSSLSLSLSLISVSICI